MYTAKPFELRVASGGPENCKKEEEKSRVRPGPSYTVLTTRVSFHFLLFFFFLLSDSHFSGPETGTLFDLGPS